MPGMSRARPAEAPVAIMNQVTVFAETPVGSSTRVRYGEIRRRYRSATQCSEFFRPRTAGGWVTARSSSIVGRAGRCGASAVGNAPSLPGSRRPGGEERNPAPQAPCIVA